MSCVAAAKLWNAGQNGENVAQSKGTVKQCVEPLKIKKELIIIRNDKRVKYHTPEQLTVPPLPMGSGETDQKQSIETAADDILKAVAVVSERLKTDAGKLSGTEVAALADGIDALLDVRNRILKIRLPPIFID